MKIRVAILGTIAYAMILSGCSQLDSSTDSPNVNKNLSVLVPEYVELSKVRLPNGRRFLSLGDSEEKAMSVFSRPSRGFPIEDSVPGLPADFKSKGWDSGTEGFGVIIHDDKIVLAMHQYEAIEADEFASILVNIQETNGIDRFRKVMQDKAEYWYVKEGRDVLAISRVAGTKMRYQVTVTIGNEHLMNTLGILRDVKKEDSLSDSDSHAL